jgi:hypothetical protein
VVTEEAFAITETTATLNATVNPNGNETECEFEYGTSTAYGSRVPCSSSPGSGESPVAVSADVGSLTAVTNYHFRIVAENRGNTSYGDDQTFTTSPGSPGSAGFALPASTSFLPVPPPLGATAHCRRLALSGPLCSREGYSG